MNIPIQDWTNVVFKKKNINTSENKKKSFNNQKLYKLDNQNESHKIKRISLKLSKQIQNARIANNLNQKELANKLNVHYSLIVNYENGKAIPDNNIKIKLQNILKIKFN